MAFKLLFVSIFLISLPRFSVSQPQAPAPAIDACNGIFLSYTYVLGERLPPVIRSDPSRQAYRFKSTLTILNNSLDELKSWKVFVGFKHNEFLVSASQAVLNDSTSLLANVTNRTIFAGFPLTDLKTAIDTAEDLTQTQVQIELIGTQFGVAAPAVPLPSNITLANDGFSCPRATVQGKCATEFYFH